MIGEAARVVGQKAQCFDCITHSPPPPPHPPRERRWGQKGVGTQKLGFFRPRNENLGEKKETTLLLTVPEKGKCVYICQQDKRYCEALLRLT